MLAAGTALAAGCVAEPTKLVPSSAPLAPSAAPVAAKADDWNIFPDPLTGRVEIYKNGEHVGSVTGDETEDPPIPRKREQ